MPAKWLWAEAPNHVWAIDYQYDHTADGRILKLLQVVDEFTREARAIECQRRIDADKTAVVLALLVAQLGTAGHIRYDNGTELTAHALRGWCRFPRSASAYIEAGSPWQNPYAESFGSRVRDELLSGELVSCLTEPQVLIEDRHQDYNTNPPHSSLGMRSPAAFAAILDRPLVPTAQQQSETAEITSPLVQSNSLNGYGPRLTTLTRLALKVDR